MIEHFLTVTVPEVFETRLALAAVAVLASALIRGYAGFGVALMMIPALTLLYGPLEAIAVTLVIGLAGQAQLLPWASRRVHWPELGPLAAGIGLAAPFGAWLLFATDPEIIRRAIGVLVIAISALLATGWTYGGRRSWPRSMVAGALCGFVTGASGMGAPLAAIYFLSADHGARTQRANIILAMFTLIVVLLVPFVWRGAVGPETLARALLVFPITLLGTWAGSRLFQIAPEAHYRRFALGLVIATGLAVLVF